MAVPIPTTTPPLVCWNCQERAQGTHFCGSCGKVLQLPENSDYFAMLDLPRKLWIGMDALEGKFLTLSWRLHPDKFVNATAEEREISLKRSSELNDAYRALKDPIARIEYLLSIEGQRNEGDNKQKAPPELLEEVFLMNESLEELQYAREHGMDPWEAKARLESIQKTFREQLDEVDQELKGMAEQWDKAVDGNADQAKRKEILGWMNERLNRRSYIRNLVKNVEKALAEA